MTTTQTLPDLTGSEKQVSWATDIRNAIAPKLLEIESIISDQLSMWENPPQEMIKGAELIRKKRDAILGTADAAKWINLFAKTYKRNPSVQDVIDTIRHSYKL